jgi:hypothetical protein
MQPYAAPGPASPPQPKNVLDKSVLDSLYNQAPTQPVSYGGMWTSICVQVCIVCVLCVCLMYMCTRAGVYCVYVLYTRA